jgi:hypothetical protein
MTVLDSETIAQRVAAAQSAATLSEGERVAAAQERHATITEAQVQSTRAYQYVRPLSDSYANVIDAIENVEHRFMFGLEQIDMRTRGFGAKELVLITGFAHAGKTQLVNTAILNNKDRRILFFSMDDPAEMILVKLACMAQGVDAETLERRIKQGDERSKLALQQAATLTFQNLIVVDESLGLTAMDQAIREATAYWGGIGPDAVFIDYLGSMASDGADESDGGGIKQKAAALKRWVKDKPFPTIVLHQNTRSNGRPGAPITLLSGGYGGEQEATFVIGVRRKRDDEDLDGFVRDQHANTVTLHLVKNKRPPGKKTATEGVDFWMEPNTGVIRMRRDDDRGGVTDGTSEDDASETPGTVG